jgi:2-ketoarginine methyltransferase
MSTVASTTCLPLIKGIQMGEFANRSPNLPGGDYHPPRKVTQNLPILTEEKLILGLQPIRQFVLAQALYYFMDTGIQEAIASSRRSLTIEDLAKKFSLHKGRLRGFIQYLANEGFVLLIDGDVVRLTADGEKIANFQPWYTLLIGGYAQTLLQLPTALRADGTYADRDSARVGVGSCGISQHDALPMTRRLLNQISDTPRTLVDVGCGDGGYLIELCRWSTAVRGIGIEPDIESAVAARQLAETHGIAHRIDVKVGSAAILPALDLDQHPKPLCFITAFVLQEILAQEGRAAVVHLLSTVFENYPDASWIVIEVDHRPDDVQVMSHALGLAYYNPYYLIHQLTEQTLEPAIFWEQVYLDAGLRVVSREYPDPSYDSLRLKIGFLLVSDKLHLGRQR